MNHAATQRAALGVLTLCTLMNMLSRGIGESFAVFLLPIAREFGADRAALTGVYSTYMMVIGLMSPIAGYAVDRLGPRRCYVSGLVLLAIAYSLAGRMQALWQMYVLIGGLSAVGSTLIGMVPASSLTSRWFLKRLPTAMGMLSAALGTGMLVVAPFVQAAVEGLGWRAAYQVIGYVLIALLAPVLFLPWRRIAAGSAEVVGATAFRTNGEGVWSVARALRTRVFWALSAVMFVTSITTYTINVQLVACLIESGYSPMQAASIFGLVGMSSIIGMLGAGMLAERLGERWVATLSYCATVTGIGLLAVTLLYPSVLVVAAFVLTFGTMQGSRGPLVATLAARNFPGAMGRVYGMVLLSMGAGAAAGSWASGFLFDLTGGYQAGFVLAAAGAAVGLALFWSVHGLADSKAPAEMA